MSRHYRITHHTTYSYDDDVTGSFGLAYSRPRDMAGQTLREHELWTDPGHADLGSHQDADGNQATFFHVTEPHRRLTVSAVSLVDVVATPLPTTADELPWEQGRPAVRRDLVESTSASAFTVASAKVDVGPAAAAYAAASFTPGRPLREAVTELVARVHAEFEYRPGSTTVSTRVDDVLRLRHGVCQDFAHLAIACLRSQGLAARYVSGYLATEPPPGRSGWWASTRPTPGCAAAFPARAGSTVDPTNDCVDAGPARHRGLGPRLRRRAPGQGHHLHRGQDIVDEGRRRRGPGRGAGPLGPTVLPMRSFTCGSCGQTLYFENSVCVSCGAAVGYSRVQRDMLVLGTALVPCVNLDLNGCNWIPTSPARSAVSCR